MLHLQANWMAILVAAVAAMAVGMLWYSDGLFGKEWRRLMKMGGKKKKKPMGKELVLGFLSSVVAAYVLSKVLMWFGAWNLMSALDATLWTWVGFTGTMYFGQCLWEKRPSKLSWINAGHSLLSFLVMAAVLVSM